MDVTRRRLSFLGALIVLSAAGGSTACGAEAGPTEDDIGTTKQALASDGVTSAGLSLWFENGSVRLENGTPKVLSVYGDTLRYVQELDVTSTVQTTTDQGITPVMQSGDMAQLDWSGVQQVDEDWRPELGTFPKTYTRSRFYRGATWMKRWSMFAVLPVDANGAPVGAPIVELAGSDAEWLSSDDGFVRRFDARQVTRGCQAIGDCSNATSFTAQALAQVRNATHADIRAQTIPANAKKLALFWTEQPTKIRTVQIERKALTETPYKYGFTVGVDVISQPANQSFYVPGEEVAYRITMRDGAGNRLHPEGQLPSYMEFATDNVPSGIRYYDGFQETLTLYYALKHREGNNIWNFSGPTDKLKYSDHIVSDMDFFFLSGTGGITSANVAENGYVGLFDIFPTVMGTIDPVLSAQPNSDVIRVKIPADAPSGTYMFAFKGRRDWGGEALNHTGTAEVQVGQAAATVFAPKTGNCGSCHNDASSLKNILHGTSDRRTCYGCHMPMEQEPDQALDYRIHLIHSRSKRVPGNVNDCAMCHTTPPTGPARGFPGVGF